MFFWERGGESVTDKGRKAFVASLQDALPEDRFRSPFLFAMMFSDLLPGQRVEEMLDAYIADAEAKLAQMKTDCQQQPSSPGEAFVCEYGRAVYESILQFLRLRRIEFKTDALKAAAE